ncbi:MAG: hypothetical protein JNK61_01100 [Bacteroidia bacterium]|nr:hypothetical protein [Bacteroidia bacterium]HQV00935.1 hypothetical protein [Bacteroidia bacterium]
MITVRMPVAAIVTFVWIGYVCSISFMEAWLKFTAPGVTLPIGLSIGRLVFNALNKVEWIFALSVLGNIIYAKQYKVTFNSWYLITISILLLQTIWLLPALDARAEQYVQGQTPPASNLHYYFVVLEVIKVTGLSLFGISQFRNNKQLST